MDFDWFRSTRRKPFSNVPFVCLNQYDFKNLKHNIQQVNLGTWSVNGSDNCITVPDFQKYHLSSPLFPSS